VIHITDTEEDTVKEEYQVIDQYKVAKDMGIYQKISIKDPFYNITTESIAIRVY
jgi:hypothetical protein